MTSDRDARAGNSATPPDGPALDRRGPGRTARSAPSARRSIGHDLLSLRVFVPGIMGLGLLLSLGIVILDGLRRGATGRTYERRARLSGGQVAAAAVQAAETTEPREPREEPVPDGLRRPATYVVTAALFLGVAVYTVSGATYNYLAMPWIRHVAWVWAVSLVVALCLAYVGAAAASVALRRRTPPTFAWPVLARTPLGASPAPRSEQGQGWRRQPRGQGFRAR